MDDTKETSRHYRTNAHMMSQRHQQNEEGLHAQVQARKDPNAEREKWVWVPTSNPELFEIGILLQRENLFSLMKSYQIQ